MAMQAMPDHQSPITNYQSTIVVAALGGFSALARASVLG
jgi:hypothetical protein